MQQVWITKVGRPEVLEVREAPDPVPAAAEVRIRVRASGINFADIMARLGIYPDAPKLPAVVGYEVSGEIDAIGEGVEGFNLGDQVFATCRFGGYSDTVVLRASAVFLLPGGFSCNEGAAMPVNYLTAYQMLFVMGSIARGDKVLVHSAGGGVGLAALELCKIAGAEVIGIASEGKHDFLRSKGIQSLCTPQENWEARVKEFTSGKGVQIVLDPVGGRSWAQGLKALSPTGRLVCFGFSGAVSGKKRSLTSTLKQLLSIPWLKVNPITLMNGNNAVVGVNLGHLWHRPDMIQKWTTQLLTWAEEGRIRPTIAKTFPLQDASKAHHYIQDRKNIGKVLLVNEIDGH